MNLHVAEIDPTIQQKPSGGLNPGFSCASKYWILLNSLMKCLGALFCLVFAWSAQAATVGDLRCEYRENPVGIDAARPRLSWVLSASERNVKQTAWQVLVASTAERLSKDQGDLWDSGKVESDRSIQNEYAGKALESSARCYWKVRVWTGAAEPSAWSTPASWSMGLLKPGDWQARWIGFDEPLSQTEDAKKDNALFSLQGLKWAKVPEKSIPSNIWSACLRKSVVLPADRPVRRAVIALYAFNESEAFVNGNSAGHAVHWDRTARLDVTRSLSAGTNLLAVMATHTDAHHPAVLGKCVVQFASGDDLVIPIDNTWKASAAPAEGWNKPGFDDAAWGAAEITDKTPWNGPAPVADLARVPASYLRKTFAVPQFVKRATVYVTALGVYELRINGKRVGHDVLTPGWTEFRKRVHYQTYDVSDLVDRGDNAMGAILGDGWYASTLAHLARRNVYGGQPRFRAQLVIELSDGTTQVVTTDNTWKAATGPILHADLLMGCEYDARLAASGWDAKGFDDKAWKPVVEGGPDTSVEASLVDPSRVDDVLRAVKMTEPRPGCWTFDLGQNMVGWARIKVHGEAGQRITVRHGEMLNPDGTLYTASLRSCPAADFYILSGKGEETLEPYFTFHGFRYVEIRGLTMPPTVDAVQGVVIHTTMRRTGRFECSESAVNQLYSNIIWGQKGNYLEVPTDCPQRDERMGWTGDTQFFAPTAAYNFDVAPFFTRWLATCRDNQNADGTFPHVVPDIMGGGGATAWGDAALLCAYNIYRVYGDTRLIDNHFAAMDRYMKWLDTKTKDGISNVGGFGDWLNAGGGASGPAIDTAYHAHLAGIMSEMARAIGKNEDADRYARLRDEVKTAFDRTFFKEDGSLKDCSQTGYALAFTMNLVPDGLREKATSKFIDEIKKFDWHLATGFIGTPRLLPALNIAGRNDVACRLLLQDTYPSWLFPVKNGATTMWERWNGWTPETGFGDISMNSFNHYAFGAVGEYLYGGIGGIQPASPGYKTILIRPAIGSGITAARTEFNSIHGLITTRWKHEDDTVTLAVTIPANTTARVWIPTSDAKSVTEQGKPVAQVPGVQSTKTEPGAVVLELGSGVYEFHAALK
jgi:alpha-L-rhamnosidase